MKINWKYVKLISGGALCVAVLYTVWLLVRHPGWKLMDALSGTGFAIIGTYASAMLVRSYWCDYSATKPENTELKGTLIQQAENYRKLGSLLPWPLGLLAVVSAALAVAVAIQKLVVALP